MRDVEYEQCLDFEGEIEGLVSDLFPDARPRAGGDVGVLKLTGSEEE
ncbi:hypothetical protein [Sinorhizobium fredii]